MVQKILCVMLITVCSLCAKAQVTLSFSALEFSSILKGESDTLTFGITNTGSTPQDVRVVITDRGNPLKYQPGNFHFGGSNPIEDSVLILTLNPGESRTSIPIYFYGQSFGQKEALVKTTNSGVETVGLVYGEVQKRSDRSLLKPGERYVDFLRVQKGLVQNQIVTFKNSTNRTLNVMEYLKPKLYPDIFSIKDDITVDPPKLLFPSETLELTVQCIMDFYGEVHDTITVLSDGADSKYYSENYIILSATCYDEGAKFRVLIAEDLSHTMYVNEIGDSISKKVIIENIGVKEGKYAIQLNMGEFFSINGKSTVDTVTLKANASDTIAIQYKAGKEERVGDFLSIFLSNPIPGLQTTSTLNGIVLRKDTVYLYVENSSPSLSDSHQVVVRLQSTLSNNAKKVKLDFQFNQSESKPLFAHHVISKTGDQIFATAHLDVENNIVGEPLVRLHFERIDKQKLQPYFFANDVLWYDANEFNLPIPTVIIHPTASVTENGIEARYTQQLVAYPNPVYNTLSIQALGIQDYTTLDVYDLAGNIVLHNSIVPKAGQVEQLNIEHLTPGMYTVRARSGVKSAFCRIIKQ